MKRWLALVIGVLAAAPASAAPEAGRFTPKQLEAQFAFDLGADQIDVSGYPKVQRERYAVFASVCSRCHTLARPINAPLASRADWRRFISRMHVRSRIQSDKTFTREQARAIVDFLAYDASIRKVRGKEAFQAETERLNKLFAEVKAERTRLQIENDQKKARPYGDQPPVTPRP